MYINSCGSFVELVPLVILAYSGIRSGSDAPAESAKPVSVGKTVAPVTSA